MHLLVRAVSFGCCVAALLGPLARLQLFSRQPCESYKAAVSSPISLIQTWADLSSRIFMSQASQIPRQMDSQRRPLSHTWGWAQMSFIVYRLGNHQTVPNICQALEVWEDAHRYTYQRVHKLSDFSNPQFLKEGFSCLTDLCSTGLKEVQWVWQASRVYSTAANCSHWPQKLFNPVQFLFLQLISVRRRK